MKAQARKILALIMAMVMCLSLAAPAFAASEEAPEAPEASTSAEVETEAPEKEEEGKLETQATAVTETDDKGNYTFADTSGNIIVTGSVLNASQPTNVKVTMLQAATNLIGVAPTAGKYKVEATIPTATAVDIPTGGWSAPVATVGSDKVYTMEIDVAPAAGSGTKTIDDVKADEWKTLSDAQSTFTGTDNKKYQVKGAIYEETLPNGTVNAYFRLSKFDSSTGLFDDSTKIDLVTKNIAAVGSDTSKLADALKNAKTCNIYGDDTSGTAILSASVAKETTETVASQTKYAYNIINQVDVSVSAASGSWVVGGTNTVPTCTVAADKTTGTFEVSIQNKTGSDSTKWFYLTKGEEVEEFVKKALTGQPVTVESVVAASGNYWTVTVSKKQGADPVTATSYSKNVVSYGSTAVLIDPSKSGWYNATSEKGANAATIAASTEATGQVVVRVSDIPTGVTATATAASYLVGGTYYVFDSVKDLGGMFTSSSCKVSGSIPYAELKMNPIIGGKVNALVAVTANGFDEGTGSNAGKFVTVNAAPVNTLASLTVAATNVTEGSTVGVWAGADYDHDRLTYTVAPATSWYNTAFDTPNAAFVNKGKVEVKAATHTGNLVAVVEETAPTCAVKGSKTTKSVCTDCNEVVSVKTEEIPTISDPVEKYVPSDPTKWAFSGKGSTNHYCAKQETTTTTNAATGEITVTTTYTCNFGVVHPEMTKTETAKKAELQNSGRWDNFSMEKVTAVELWAAGSAGSKLAGLVKSVTVADTDVELTTFPINDSTNKTFKFNVGKNFASNLSTDGNYYDYDSKNGVEVYTSANGLPTTKNYAAKLTIKDIKAPTTQCEDASCTVVVDVYELAKGVTYASIQAAFESKDADKFAKLLSDKKISLVKNHTEAVTIPGEGHKYVNMFGEATEYCVVCGEKRDVSEETKKITADTITVSDVTYTGKPVLPNVVVKDSEGNMLIKGIDYEMGVENDNATDVGTYTVVVKGIGDYAGYRISKSYKINKAAQPMKLSATTVNAKVKDVKKKAKTYKLKVTKAQGAVTVKSNKKNVSWKSNKVTVKKGTKKMTAKLTFKAAGNANYKSGSKTAKVVIK